MATTAESETSVYAQLSNEFALSATTEFATVANEVTNESEVMGIGSDGNIISDVQISVEESPKPSSDNVPNELAQAQSVTFADDVSALAEVTQCGSE